MAEKIYGIVTGGEFTDTSVVGLFLEESDRDAYLEKFIAVGKYEFSDGARAVEFPLNPSLYDLSYADVTFVDMFKDGHIRRTRCERALILDIKAGFVDYITGFAIATDNVSTVKFAPMEYKIPGTHAISMIYAVQTPDVAIAIKRASEALKQINDNNAWGDGEKTIYWLKDFDPHRYHD